MTGIAKSYKEESEMIKEVIDFCTTCINENAYQDGDVRTAVFSNIRGIGYVSAFLTNLLDSWCVGDENIRKVIPQLIGLLEVNEKSVKFAGDGFHKSGKLSLALLANFQIENFVVHILNSLKSTGVKKSFHHRINSLLDILSLEEYREDFIILSLIRNSLHSNGIHESFDGRDSKFQRSGLDFEFIHGKVVECASLSHIVLALKNVLIAINKIINCDKVKEIKVIKDTFYFQKIENSKNF